MGDYSRKYIQENMPKKQYTRKRFIIRKKKPYEILWSDVLLAVFIIAMLVMLVMNYIANKEYVPREEEDEETEIIVDVGIEKNMDTTFSGIDYSGIQIQPDFF